MKSVKYFSIIFSLLAAATVPLRAQPPGEGEIVALPDFISSLPRHPGRTKVQAGLQAPVDSNCIFRTQTQGGWGSTPHGNNPGSYLHVNFSAAFPAGVTVGCNSGFTLTLTSAQAVTDYLPAGGRPAALSSSLTDPIGYSNNLASQLVALTLSLGFDQFDTSFGSASSQLAGATIASGPFAGWSLQMVVDEANALLGGCPSPSTSAFTYNMLNNILSEINQSFVDGEVHNSTLLVCAQDSCSHPQLAFEFDDTLCNGVPFHIMNQSQGIDSNAMYYLDINNDGTFDINAPASDLPDDTLIFLPFEGLFDFTVVVVNSDGCSDTLLETIEILPIDSCMESEFGELVVHKTKNFSSEPDVAAFAINAYPNPFTKMLNIGVILAEDSKAQLQIFNLVGQHIATLFEGTVKGGELNTFEFAPDNLMEGVIIYRLQTWQAAYYGKAVMVR